MARKNKRKIIHGVAVNDVYNPQKVGEPSCKILRLWRNMIRRCYCEKSHIISPTYKDCTVCEDWLTYSNFKKWVKEQKDWENKTLDKDLLFEENKIYSPETCIFIDQNVNKFLVNSKVSGTKGYLQKASGKFMCRVKHPITHKSVYLGLFENQEDCTKAWKLAKHEMATILAETQQDTRVSQALIKKFRSDTNVQS